MKPLAGGHSSGAPALPYGIGVSGVPNHAEHTTSQRALPKIPIDPSCANSPSAITSSIRPGATSKARQRANRPEKGKKAREVRTWRGRAEIALPPGSQVRQSARNDPDQSLNSSGKPSESYETGRDPLRASFRSGRAYLMPHPLTYGAMLPEILVHAQPPVCRDTAASMNSLPQR